MSENRIPTEQELDMLLEQAPRFDLDAVKRRTLSRIEGTAAQSAGKLFPLHSLFVAAVVCALSISALAAADHVTGGKIKQALKLQTVQTEETAPAQTQTAAAEPTPEHEVSLIPTLPEASPEPEGPKAEPPELDEQIAGALQIQPAQAESLRPAVQAVEQTAVDKDIRMTVLQTLGDPSCLYIKLRFDFPEEVPVTDELQFENIDIDFDKTGSFSWSHPILERTETAVTYLFKVQTIGEALSGQTITVSCENYGQSVEVGDHIQFQLKADEKRTIIVSADGQNINATATEEDIAALPAGLDAAKTAGDGFTIGYMTDGTRVVTYDGTHGVQYVTILDGDVPHILTGADPTFQMALEGSWTQSWTLDYQDTSVYWSGEQQLFDPTLTMTNFRISPLSWGAVMEGNELTPLTLPKNWDVQLLHSDGTLTEVPLRWHTSSPRTTEDFHCTMTVLGTFDQSIDLSGVTAVIMDGTEFPLGPGGPF